MSKGRSTTRISARLSDDILALFKAKAAKKGLPYTVFVRQLIQKEMGLPQR